MNNLEEIIQEIKEFPQADRILAFREVQDLPTIMYDGEPIHFITVGTQNGNKGLLIATDNRVLFVYTEHYITRALKIPYKDIEHIYKDQKDIESTIELFFTETKVVINKIPSLDVPSFVDIVENYIEEIFVLNDRLASSNLNKSYPRKENRIFKVFGYFGIVVFVVIVIGIGINIYDHYVGTEKLGTEDSSTIAETEYEVVEVNHNPPEYALSVEDAETEYGLEISELEKTNDEYYEYITGTIINNSDLEYSSIYVDIQLFDKDGHVIDSTIDSLEKFKPGQTWSFKTEYYNKYAVDFKISGITVFELK
ncbi:FxLYD domain-containing protein [Bacillus sp. JJ1521]|uniref:FxLYD domain-containing protein n=1 Tax=Bacillus sp. JJ1521 TaxID=3122957 RepID=UPI002FFFA7F1